MAPPSVYEVYRPAPQRSSNATAIITSMRLSFSHASVLPLTHFTPGLPASQPPMRLFRIAARNRLGQAITHRNRHRRKIAEGLFERQHYSCKGNLRTNTAKVLVNGMCRLWVRQPVAHETV